MTRCPQSAHPKITRHSHMRERKKGKADDVIIKPSPHHLYNHSVLHIRCQTTAYELVHHLKGIGWLVHWYEMSSFIYLHKVKLVCRTKLCNCFAIHLPLVVRCAVELVFAVPFKSLGPRLVAKPIADVVLVASINQNFNVIVQQVRNHGVEIDH